LNNTKQIFVVGNSRSGTTMMGRILNNHLDIFTFKELHFFGQLWSEKDKEQKINKIESIKLFSKLLCIQKFGIFQQDNPSKFDEVSESVLEQDIYTRIEIFNLFLEYSVGQNNSSISCNQTPRDVFYINEILENFPEAKIINMIRDPRDILLSQKNKWKRRYLGASSIPFREAVRSYFNYHPITISKIWNTSVSAALSKNSNNIITIQFENLVENSEKEIKKLCLFLGIHFSEDLLQVPNIGSSTNADKSNVLGLDNQNTSKWKEGGLMNAEIYICQKMCKNNMRDLNYEFKRFRFFPLFTTVLILTFPVKIFISFLLNLHRIKNFKELIQKRILNK
jgi:hypothetical protein